MEMYKYKDAILSEQDRGRISGMLPVFLPEMEEVPTIRWKDTKISPLLWGRIKSFLLWSQQQFHSEAQIRLYFNDRSKRWRALVWPQYIGTGMYSEEIDENKWGIDPDIKAKVARQKAALLTLVDPDKGWYEYGTVHHHCTASAFQSGTDHKDEIDRPGIHITVGHILSDTYDLHARFVINKTLYKVVLEDWIGAVDLAEPTHNKFPGLWTIQCLEKPRPVIKPWTPGQHNAGFHGNMRTTATQQWRNRWGNNWYDTTGDDEDNDLPDSRGYPRYDSVVRQPEEPKLVLFDRRQDMDIEELLEEARQETAATLDMLETTRQDTLDAAVEMLEQEYRVDLDADQCTELSRRVSEAVIDAIRERLEDLEEEHACLFGHGGFRDKPHEPINEEAKDEQQWGLVPVENMP